VVVAFDDWKAYLPSTFPTNRIDNVFIRIMIVKPRSSTDRTVAVNIECDIKLDAPLPPILNIQFAAQPLVAGEYEYRLTVGAPPILWPNTTNGLTLVNVCTAIGMGDISSNIVSAIPILGQLLSAIQVIELSAADVQTSTDATTYHSATGAEPVHCQFWNSSQAN
jgi:hypothetical protein